MKLLTQHLRSFNNAWYNILTKPVEHLINIMALTVIIAICMVAIIIGNNLSHWQQKNILHPQITIYLERSANSKDIARIEKELHKFDHSLISNYKFISKEQALTELQEDKNLKEIASDTLEENANPLPDVFIVETATNNSQEIERINIQLGQLPKVDNSHVDLNYAQKISHLVKFSSIIVQAIQLICIVLVALVVYNIIRLQMLLKVDAISVSRLIGASDSFIMRPLIHYAVWQVTLATSIAALLVHFLDKYLNQLLSTMQPLFGNGIQILPLPWLQMLVIWLVLTIFTVFTVFIAVRWVFRNTYHI